MISTLSRAIQRWIFKRRNSTLGKRYPQYKFGRGTYGDLYVRSYRAEATLQVGNYTSIAQGVQVLLGGEHRPDWVTTFPFSVLWDSAKHHEGHPATKGNVTIGNDVWIGTEALIISGVTVGHGAVIGARAVVTRDVPPYSIVVGNPAKVVKHRFDEQTIERLQGIQWWNWTDVQIKKAMPDLLSSQIAIFLERAERGVYFESVGALDQQ
jgi:acetyltransferase-like isoleucine patch superfamily enzyme